MKKNDWILITAVAAYSYLFYQQSFGINFLIFSIVMIGLLIARNGAVYKNRNWMLAAIGTLVSGCCIAYYGNGLSFIANVISLGVLSAFSMNTKTSIITSLLFSIYSTVASYVFVILDAIKRSQNRTVSPGNQTGGIKFLLYAIPFIIAVVFFFMYKASNPLFDNFTKRFNLDFISIGWVFFTIGGFLLMYAFFNHRRIKRIAEKDEQAHDTLYYEQVHGKKTFLKLTIENEKLSGMILLSMLNVLLFIVNALDANYLFFDGTLPKDLNYSSFVHQGTGMLITSIIIAILIIMFYFRGELNFNKGSIVLKVLAFLWVFQNAFMIISTAYRNNLYINEYSLTYKRIGVYIWLLLAMIGLVTTFIKIVKIKSNWFLFRSNGWLFYFVLLISCLINWDVIVSDFNINRSQQKHKPLDKTYLLSLSERNIPQLLLLNDSIKDSVSIDDSDLQYIEDSAPADFKKALNNKLYCFLDEMEHQDWRSFCFEKKQVYRYISRLSDSISEINLEGYYLQTLKPLNMLSHLKTVYFSRNQLIDLSELKMYPTLENLYLAANQFDSIDFLPRMEALKILDLSDNNLVKLYELKYAPHLLSLDISGNKQIDFKTIPSLKKLEILSANNIFLNDFTPLLQLPNLKDLSLCNSIAVNKEKLPLLPKLQRLSISTNQITSTDTVFFQKLSSYNNLTYLNLSNNQMDNLYPLTSHNDMKKTLNERSKLLPVLPYLKSLDVSNNNIHSLNPLFEYKNLEELNVSGNKMTEISTIEEFTKLRVLSLNGCGLNSIAFLRKLKSLEILDLRNNGFTDYTPLYGMKGLNKLIIGTISKSQMKQLKKALPQTNIVAVVIN